MIKEAEVMKFLNERANLKLVASSDQYSSFDASDDNYIVEIKTRYSYYDTKMLEALKLYSNFRKSQIFEKKFLYVVADPKGVWVFNISDNMETVLNTPLMPFRCPETTQFERDKKIIKYGHVLPETLAKLLKYEM